MQAMTAHRTSIAWFRTWIQRFAASNGVGPRRFIIEDDRRTAISGCPFFVPGAQTATVGRRLERWMA